MEEREQNGRREEIRREGKGHEVERERKVRREEMEGEGAKWKERRRNKEEKGRG